MTDKRILQNQLQSGTYSTPKREFDVNYMYLFEMNTQYSQGILNFRAEIRRNNSLLVQSAKMLIQDLFHWRYRPKYQLMVMTGAMMRKAQVTRFDLAVK